MLIHAHIHLSFSLTYGKVEDNQCDELLYENEKRMAKRVKYSKLCIERTFNDDGIEDGNENKRRD